MNDPVPHAAWIAVALWLIVSVSLIAWVWIARRIASGRPLVPFKPRRPVPWGGFDVLLIFLGYLCVLAGFQLGFQWLGSFWPTEQGIPLLAEVGKQQIAHPLEVLFRQNHSLHAIFLVVVVAVVAAPLIEEFLFRLVLQGWLEKVERRLRRWKTIFRVLSPGLFPVVFSSFLFAIVHFRTAEKIDTRLHLDNLICMLLADLVTIVAAVYWLRFVRGANAADFGLDWTSFRGDIAKGLVAFIALLLPIYLIQAFCKAVFPAEIAPDPIPLFFLALALGGLYYRTHRLAPNVVLHMAWNSIAMVALFLSVFGSG